MTGRGQLGGAAFEHDAAFQHADDAAGDARARSRSCSTSTMVMPEAISPASEA